MRDRGYRGYRRGHRNCALVAGAALCAMTGSVLASGFQLLEQNASGMGVAYAGSAAVAEDASTVFFNPAGMAFLPAGGGKSHLAVGLDALRPSARFSDVGSTPPSRISAGGGEGGDAGDLHYVPHAYLVTPLNEQMVFGLGFGAPFGLKTEYDTTWVGRFQADMSDVKTVNLNPSLSYRVNERLALGFGLNYQHLEGEFTRAVNFPGAIYNMTQSASLAALAREGSARISGDDTAWGYNLGVMLQMTPELRLGVSYRSAIKYHLKGAVGFSSTGNPLLDAAVKLPGSPARGGDVYSDITLPDTLIASLQLRLDDKWDLLADLSRTGWSKIDVLQFNYADDNSSLSSTPENWRNTWRLALGASYRYDARWKLRAGMAYDQSPVGDAWRTPRLPDNDRLWLSFGAQYRLDKGDVLDLAYTHIFVRKGPINDSGGPLELNGGVDSGTLKGSFSGHVDMLGMQYSRAF